MVPGDGRRRLSEYLRDRESPPEAYRDSGRRSHLQNELSVDGRIPSRSRCRLDDRGLARRPRIGQTFGVMQIDTDQRIIGFQEKPAQPQTIPGDDHHCLASMGIYVFSTRFLLEQLCRDANEPKSQHDFGKNIIPSIIRDHRVMAFPLRDENRKQDAYWRDVGTLDALLQANMDLVNVNPLLNLYDDVWPIRTFQPNLPPPKFDFGSRDYDGERCGMAIDSVVCAEQSSALVVVERSNRRADGPCQQLQSGQRQHPLLRGRSRSPLSDSARDHR